MHDTSESWRAPPNQKIQLYSLQDATCRYIAVWSYLALSEQLRKWAHTCSEEQGLQILEMCRCLKRVKYSILLFPQVGGYIPINAHLDLPPSPRILAICHGVLYKQLSAWMLHGLLLDEEGEFFIEAAKKTPHPVAKVSMHACMIMASYGLSYHVIVM